MHDIFWPKIVAVKINPTLKLVKLQLAKYLVLELNIVWNPLFSAGMDWTFCQIFKMGGLTGSQFLEDGFSETGGDISGRVVAFT